MEVNRFYKSCLTLAVAAMISGCAGQPSLMSGTPVQEDASEVTVRLIVSENFGRNVIHDEEVTVDEGTSCLDVLSGRLDITTAYGGGFVTSIEGVKSGYLQNPVKREDWFLYINGILSNTGGLSYRVKDGDVIHWYHREWGFRPSVSALIGDFPSSFKNGYAGDVSPVTIWYEEGWLDEAGILLETLLELGVGETGIRDDFSITPDEKQYHNLIIIGSADFQPIAEINSNWQKIGLFHRFSADALEIYSSSGNLDASIAEGAGIITAMQNPFNPYGTGACQNTCWVISGTDRDSIIDAFKIFVNNPESFGYYAGAIVISGDVEPLP